MKQVLEDEKLITRLMRSIQTRLSEENSDLTEVVLLKEDAEIFEDGFAIKYINGFIEIRHICQYDKNFGDGIRGFCTGHALEDYEDSLGAIDIQCQYVGQENNQDEFLRVQIY